MLTTGIADVKYAELQRSSPVVNVKTSDYGPGSHQIPSALWERHRREEKTYTIERIRFFRPYEGTGGRTERRGRDAADPAGRKGLEVASLIPE